MSTMWKRWNANRDSACNNC